jgi:uncharacterized protein YxjI
VPSASLSTPVSVPVATYHVRKTSLGPKRKYRISDDAGGRPGEPIGYAEKRLKVADEVVVYRDRQRRERLVTVRESSAGWLAALTGYEVVDPDGRVLGGFGLRLRESWQRSTWQLDQPGLGRLVGTERSLTTARVRRLLGLAGEVGEIAAALVRHHYDFTRDGEVAASIEKPKVLDDWYRIVVHDEAIDPRLLFGLAIMLEAREH